MNFGKTFSMHQYGVDQQLKAINYNLNHYNQHLMNHPNLFPNHDRERRHLLLYREIDYQ